MKTVKKDNSTTKLTGEQIVKKKLDEANMMLKNTDLSILRESKPTTKQD